MNTTGKAKPITSCPARDAMTTTASRAAVGPGDVTHTPSGQGHGIANTGKVPLEFIALILADD